MVDNKCFSFCYFYNMIEHIKVYLTYLESVQEAWYFNPSLAEEELNEDKNFSDDSSDDETGFDIDFEFSKLHLSDRSKVETFKLQNMWMYPWWRRQVMHFSSSTAGHYWLQKQLYRTWIIWTGFSNSGSNLKCHKLWWGQKLGKKKAKGQRTRVPFSAHGRRICFLFMHRLHKTQLYSSVKH